MNTYKIIAAISQKRVLGKDNKLLWRQSEDLKRFKSLTTNGVILMGRKTFESIGSRPLPNRRNIVLTSRAIEGVECYASITALEEAIRDETIWVIGGGEVYRSFLDKASLLEITEVSTNVDGDTFFPIIAESEWLETKRNINQRDLNNEFNYTFVTYQRKIKQLS